MNIFSQRGYQRPNTTGSVDSNDSLMTIGHTGSNVAMVSLAHSAFSMARCDDNPILKECRAIDAEIGQIERDLEQLRLLQGRVLGDSDVSSSSASNRKRDALSGDTMALYRKLTDRVRTVKSNPEANTPKNKPQVSRVGRRLKEAIQQYQQLESGFCKRAEHQMARQYRIVRPEASDQEVHAAVQDPTTNNQIFSQALRQSDRQGRAYAALSAVRDRHKALVRIEQDMIELSHLFKDLDTLITQQDAAVTRIEEQGAEAAEDVTKGSNEIGVAVNTARKTRRKKWICLGICAAIVVLIVLAVLIYTFTNRAAKKK